MYHDVLAGAFFSLFLFSVCTFSSLVVQFYSHPTANFFFYFARSLSLSFYCIVQSDTPTPKRTIFHFFFLPIRNICILCALDRCKRMSQWEASLNYWPVETTSYVQVTNHFPFSILHSSFSIYFFFFFILFIFIAFKTVHIF